MSATACLNIRLTKSFLERHLHQDEGTRTTLIISGGAPTLSLTSPFILCLTASQPPAMQSSIFGAGAKPQ